MEVRDIACVAKFAALIARQQFRHEGDLVPYVLNHISRLLSRSSWASTTTKLGRLTRPETLRMSIYLAPCLARCLQQLYGCSEADAACYCAPPAQRTIINWFSSFDSPCSDDCGPTGGNFSPPPDFLINFDYMCEGYRSAMDPTQTLPTTTPTVAAGSGAMSISGQANLSAAAALAIVLLAFFGIV